MSEINIILIKTTVEDKEMYVISGGKNQNFFANGILVSDENIMTLQLERYDVVFSEFKK